jgi:speckle-type POZ protein
MVPRVFKALLHFIYTDTLPWVIEGDEIAIAIGPLVAAERYGMIRLGSICERIPFSSTPTHTRLWLR